MICGSWSLGSLRVVNSILGEVISDQDPGRGAEITPDNKLMPATAERPYDLPIAGDSIMFVIQPLISQLVGVAVRLVTALAGKDRRLSIIERRPRLLALVRELEASGLKTSDLRNLERQLTKE